MSLPTISTLDPKPFKNFIVTVGNLPSSFVDSMSYYEMLAWICQYIQNNIIPTLNLSVEQLNTITSEFAELKAYVEAQVDDIAQLRSDFITFTEHVNQLIDQYQEQVEEHVNEELNAFRINIELLVSESTTSLNNKINREVARLDDKIDNVIVSNLTVFNASLGIYQTLQECLDYLFNYQRTDALTAKEYDDLELTAKAYDDELISAFDYDNFAKTILVNA